MPALELKSLQAFLCQILTLGCLIVKTGTWKGAKVARSIKATQGAQERIDQLVNFNILIF
jgi:hypothetical protein